MKISKLFHWLYAILMLAPVCAVGITCLTHVFNEEVAEETQTAEIEYKFELGITPSNFDELEINKLYKLNTTPNYDIFADLQIKYITDNTNTFYSSDLTMYYLDIQADSIVFYPNYYYSEYDYIEFNPNNTYVVQWGKDINTFDFWYNYTNGNNDYNIIKSVDISTVAQDDSTNIFYTSCEQVKDSFILSWCNTDNLTRAVFDYGSALFNVDSDNLVNYFLTYWCSISIIWLVFDVFMYVPLLVHRWIDKAKIE